MPGGQSIIPIAAVLVGLLLAGCQESEPCDPNCHWDCFGGVSCVYGEVWAFGHGGRPCCHYSDPWPEPDNPTCGTSVLFRCAGDACGGGDPRYRTCLDLANLRPTADPFLAYAALLCPERNDRVPGSPCADDADCRAAAPSVASRLRCDTALGVCTTDPRPEPPPGFGGSCGLGPADEPVPPWGSTHDVLAEGATCDLCHVDWDPSNGCWRQACTMACTFDEDCPEGAVCLCPPAGTYDVAYPGSFCARVAGRETAADRTAWLSCP